MNMPIPLNERYNRYMEKDSYEFLDIEFGRLVRDLYEARKYGEASNLLSKAGFPT